MCAECRVGLVPNRKADGGVVFGAALLHMVKPLLKRNLCPKYGYMPSKPKAAPALTREERRQARWTARLERQEAEYRANQAREEAEYQANLAAGLVTPEPPEPTDLEIIRHRSKLTAT
jgi:hypothetical protein